MAKHVYISASIQEWNAYFGGGNEEGQMQPVGQRMAAILWEHGFIVSDNNPTMTLQEVVAESNLLKPDIHVAIHSNAGGGEGTKVFCWPGGTRSEKLANLLYEEVSPLSPGKDRGVKDGRHLLEIKGTIATSALIEVELRLSGAQMHGKELKMQMSSTFKLKTDMSIYFLSRSPTICVIAYHLLSPKTPGYSAQLRAAHCPTRGERRKPEEINS